MTEVEGEISFFSVSASAEGRNGGNSSLGGGDLTAGEAVEGGERGEEAWPADLRCWSCGNG